MYCKCTHAFLLHTADEEPEVVQKIKQTEPDESEQVIDGEKEKGKLDPATSEVVRSEAQEQGGKPGEDAVKTEAAVAGPTSGPDGDLCRDDRVIEDKKQEENNKSVCEK